ncbi:hypothetical protein [Solimonas marina]|uniref:hypothetical protein n=1 Tax=Solimonas marina TaxID=2714601 RepID=UPI00344F204E
MLKAATRAADAPELRPGTLYALQLAPQEQVQFPHAPSKRMLTDGAYGGLVHFKVPTAGRYRIAIDSPFWIDVVDGGKAVSSIDFGGDPSCNAPRKIVIYALPAGDDLTLQLSAGTTSTLRITITPDPTQP